MMMIQPIFIPPMDIEITEEEKNKLEALKLERSMHVPIDLLVRS